MTQKRWSIPKEHGFWVMFSTSICFALGRSGFGVASLLTVSLVVLTTLIVASFCHKSIRTKDWAQLLSSFFLALLIVPIEISSGVNGTLIVLDLLAWATLFTGLSLAARAVFARARKKNKQQPWHKDSLKLTLLSLLLPLSSFAYLIGFRTNSTMWRVSLFGTLGLFGIALWKPMPKNLKTLGLLATAIMVLALLSAFLPVA